LTSHIRSRIEYLIQSDNNLVLDEHFILTKKLSPWQALMQFIDDSIVVSVFGYPEFFSLIEFFLVV